MHSGLPPLDEVQVVPLVQHRKRKCALHLFRHVFQAVQMEGSFLFYQLYRDVAVWILVLGRPFLQRSSTLYWSTPLWANAKAVPPAFP